MDICWIIFYQLNPTRTDNFFYQISQLILQSKCEHLKAMSGIITINKHYFPLQLLSPKSLIVSPKISWTFLCTCVSHDLSAVVQICSCLDCKLLETATDLTSRSTTAAHFTQAAQVWKIGAWRYRLDDCFRDAWLAPGRLFWSATTAFL